MPDCSTDKKDLQILFLMDYLIKAGENITLKQVSHLSEIPYKTIERRISKLKKLKLISAVRNGKHWEWSILFKSGEFSNPSISHKSNPSQPRKQPLNTAPHSPSYDTDYFVTDVSQTIDFIDDFYELEYSPNPSKSNDYIYNNNNNNNIEILNNLAMYTLNPNFSRKKVKMSYKVKGPESDLKSQINLTLSSIHRPKKKQKTSMNSTATSRLRDKMSEKSLEEYNVTDMRFIFEDAWFEKQWKGFPQYWNLKDKKLVRCMLDEQGGENLVSYFNYVLKSWDSIRRRYRLSGAPNVSVLFGYRSSLLHEALEREITGGRTVEYKGDENLTPEDMEF